jgi:hypothetical protein
LLEGISGVIKNLPITESKVKKSTLSIWEESPWVPYPTELLKKVLPYNCFQHIQLPELMHPWSKEAQLLLKVEANLGIVHMVLGLQDYRMHK